MWTIDLEKLLNTKVEDNRDLLGRLVIQETENEKFLKENTQLTKKVTDLDSALKELAVQYQNLQVNRVAVLHSCSVLIVRTNLDSFK